LHQVVTVTHYRLSTLITSALTVCFLMHNALTTEFQTPENGGRSTESSKLPVQIFQAKNVPKKFLTLH